MPRLQLLAFEAYRDLVHLMRRGLGETEGLAAAELKNIELRATAKSAATAALDIKSGQDSGPGAPSAAAPAGKSRSLQRPGFATCNAFYAACLYHLSVPSLTEAVQKVFEVFGTGKNGSIPGGSGFGQYGAVAFSYVGDGANGGATGVVADEKSDVSEDESESEDEDAGPPSDSEEGLNRLGTGFGVESFSAMLRHAHRQEKAEAEGRIVKPRCAA